MAVSSRGAVVYASGMQSKTPFLFSMPPLFAWAFAVTTSIALLLALLLMFTETTVESEEGTQGIEEAPVERQVLSSTGQAVFIGLLIGSVGLTPLMARRKRMSATRWSIAGVGTGFVVPFGRRPSFGASAHGVAGACIPAPQGARCPAAAIAHGRFARRWSCLRRCASPRKDAPHPLDGARHVLLRAAAGVLATRRVRYDRERRWGSGGMADAHDLGSCAHKRRGSSSLPLPHQCPAEPRSLHVDHAWRGMQSPALGRGGRSLLRCV